MAEQKKSPKKKRRLGRGLSSLMSQPVRVSLDEVVETPTVVVSPKREKVAVNSASTLVTGSEVAGSGGGTEVGERLRLIALGDIQPNPHQPRTEIDEKPLQALADSIRTSGVMQPILVRPVLVGGSIGIGPDGQSVFEIVAGERRWRAAKLAGLAKIPALVRETDERGSAEWALIENIQREDLNAIEKAEAFLSLIETFSLTQTEVAERVGLERSSVANLLRLNQLDLLTKNDLRAGRLQLGHAKVLLSVPDDDGNRRKLAEAAILGQWSVRELERRVALLLKTIATPKAGGGEAASRKADTAKPEHIRTLEHEMAELTGLRTEIRLSSSKKSGRVVISFATVGEFENLLAQIRNACHS